MIEPLLQAERLLLHGMLEQAEQIYRRVSEQDPLNAIAVMGLARVALERGDDEGALIHARAALAIDPDNAAAARLEARLSEVLAERARQAGLEAGVAQAGQAAEARTEQPAWASTTPAAPSSPPLAAEARPSEQVAFARNPSMADHRRREAADEAAGAEPEAAAGAEPDAAAGAEPDAAAGAEPDVQAQPASEQALPTAEPAARPDEKPKKRGLLARLLRRKGGD